jgi:hypothetical protein
MQSWTPEGMRRELLGFAAAYCLDALVDEDEDVPIIHIVNAHPLRLRGTHEAVSLAARAVRRLFIASPLGIDTNHLFHDRTGRPIPILQHGEAIAELV